MSDAACGYEREDGTRCGTGFGLCPDCGLCFNHCPHRAEDRREASRKGAQRTNRPAGSLPPGEVPSPPENLRDAVVWAAWASHAVATGELDTSRANATARLLKEFRQALERSEAREALDAIEELRDRIESGGAELEVVE